MGSIKHNGADCLLPGCRTPCNRVSKAHPGGAVGSVTPQASLTRTSPGIGTKLLAATATLGGGGGARVCGAQHHAQVMSLPSSSLLSIEHSAGLPVSVLLLNT